MLKNMTRNVQERALDAVNAVVGVCLALAPWVLGFTAVAAAAWNAWLVGAAVALVAIGALMAFSEWEEWANLALGIWAIVAPWILGFADVSYAVTAHVIAGAVIAVLAAMELWFARQRTSAA